MNSNRSSNKTLDGELNNISTLIDDRIRKYEGAKKNMNVTIIQYRNFNNRAIQK